VCNLWRAVVVAVPKIHILMTDEQKTRSAKFVRMVVEHGFRRECRLESERLNVYSKALF